MKNNKDKIANLKLEISSECTDKERSLIEKYWEMNDKYSFINSYQTLMTIFEIKKTGITKIINPNSKISFYGYCTNCKTYEFQEEKSRADFKQTFNLIINKDKSYRCEICNKKEQDRLDAEYKMKQEKQIEEENKRIEEELIYQEMIEVKAIENKVWSDMPSFHQTVLKDCVHFKNINNLERYYSEELGHKSYANLYRAMEALGLKDLLKLTFTGHGSSDLHQYSFHPNLQNVSFEKIPEVKPEVKATKNEVFYNREIEELKFRLTNTRVSSHPDKPRYSGIVRFKEEITFKPGIDYTFGMWERVNDDLYLTIIPTSKIASAPKQKSISNEPVPIQNVINNYFDNFDKRFGDFD